MAVMAGREEEQQGRRMSWPTQQQQQGADKGRGAVAWTGCKEGEMQEEEQQ